MRRSIALVTSVLAVAAVLALAPADTAGSEGPPTLVSEPREGLTGTTITVRGTGCYLPDGVTGADGLLYRLVDPAGQSVASATIAVERDGTWDGPFVVPNGLPAGEYTVQGTCIAPMYEDLGVIDGGTFTVTGEGPSAASAEAAPPTPQFPNQIEPYPAYDGQSTCSPAAKAGMVAFRDMVMRAYPSTGSFGISRDCGIGGTSEHKEGRAWDWAVNVNRAGDPQRVNELMNWLLRTDQYGNRHAMARRLGVMYIIWNRKIFRMYRAGEGWSNYTGSSPHTDHVHFSLTRAGGRKDTSFWTLRMPPPPPPPPPPEPGPGGFFDVPANAWYGDAVQWAVDHDVVSGFADQTFRPKDPVNRAQAVAWLWQQAGRPAATAPHGFSDVGAGAWYRDALSWAVEAGVVSGFSDGTYRPKDAVRRGQMAAMLWAFAERPRASGPHGFSDTRQDRWFSEAVAWVAEMGYVTGFSDGTFAAKDPVNRAQGVSWLWAARQFGDVPANAWYVPGVNWARFRSVLGGDAEHRYHPKASLPRAEMVTALWQAMDRPQAAGPHGFSDVPANAPAGPAISWAVEQGIVTGYSDGTFRPSRPVNRAQSVMMLWSMTGRLPATTPHGLTDVPDGAWFDDGLSWAVEHGVVNGYADGTFRSSDLLNRAQVAAFLRGIASSPAPWAPGVAPPSTVLF